MSGANPAFAEMAARVETRVGELRRRSFDQLAELPDSNAETIDIPGEKIFICVYRTERDADELLIVVQGARERYFGILHEMRVEGFLARSTGERIDAPKELLWDYT
jgi:hypothetical protein